MKKGTFLFPLLILLSFSLTSCDPGGQDNENGVSPTHCGNGIRDANELRPDCGGDCLPCLPEVPCIDEEFGLALFSGLPEAAVTQVVCDEENSLISISGTFGTLTLTFLADNFPSMNDKYSMKNCGLLEEGDVCARLRHKAYPGMYLFANGGPLNIKKEESGEFSISCCNVLFTNGASSIGIHTSILFNCE